MEITNRITIIQEMLETHWKEYADLVGKQYVNNIIVALEDGYSTD